MTLEYFLIAVLATYRLTLLIHKEAGPFDWFGRFRTWAGVTYDQYSNPVAHGQLSEAILCPYCLSVWISAGITVYMGLAVYLNAEHIAIYPLVVFALSGVSTFLFKWAGV